MAGFQVILHGRFWVFTEEETFVAVVSKATAAHCVCRSAGGLKEDFLLLKTSYS